MAGKNKKRKKAKGLNPRKATPWAIAGVLVVAAVAVVAVLVMTDGDSEGSGPTIIAQQVDPRVAGQDPVATFVIEAGDEGQEANPYFSPTVINAPAGEVFEILMENVGSVAHNIRVSGPDGLYFTDDDFEMTPYSVGAGDTGRVLVKIDEPGRYPFQCDFHPRQAGTLVIE